MRTFEFELRLEKKRRTNLESGTTTGIMEIGNGMTRDGFCGGADHHRFNSKGKNEEDNLRTNADPKRLAAINSTVAYSATKNNHDSSSSSLSTNETETSSISALELAKLLRDRTSSSPLVSILDCRPMNAYKQGHCIDAEHISPPPTLLYNRLKGKPDFWSGIRQQLIIPDHDNGHASTVVLIDDDQNDISAGTCFDADHGGGATNGRLSSGQRGGNQPFSSFLLSNLRNEGCTTHFLEKGEMTHFLTDYPDLCVFEPRCDNGGDDEELKNGHHDGDTSRRPCSAEPTSSSSSSSSSLLSKRQSSTPLITGTPFLLPLLKLKDLTLKQDTTSCNPAITSHSTESKDKFSDVTMINIEPTSSSMAINQFDYDKYPSSNSKQLAAAAGEGCSNESVAGKSSANDKDPVNIYATLYLGNAEHAGDLETLRRYNIRYVLNVTSDLPNRFENCKISDGEESFKYLRIPIVDNVSQNLAAYFPVANEFIDEAISRKCGVLVHCLAGISRSVTFTVAYLMKSKSCTMDEAYDLVKQRKPNIEPNLNFMRQLLDYEHALLRSGGGGGGGDVTPDSAVSSLSTSSSSSVCADTMAVAGQEKQRASAYYS